MKMKAIALLIVLLCLIGFFPTNGQNLTPKEKRKIVKELSMVISENYVLQDSVGHIVKSLKEAQGTKEFSQDHTPDTFARYLLELLRTITRDAHFAVMHDQQMFLMAKALQEAPPGSSGTPNISFGGQNLGDTRKNFFFRQLEILEGNVGYLKIEQIPPLEAAKSTIDASFTFLQHTDAMIIDLRSNAGGVGGFIPYLISYFLPEQKELLYSREFKAWDSASYHYTHEALGAPRYLEKPVFLLTNRFTGSAATNMAYTLQSLDRAIIVGENTGSGYRGAHSATLYPLANNLVGIIPIGRVVNARTQTNWRFGGVDPDIPIDPELALNMAHKQALHSLLHVSQDEEIKVELREAIEKIEKSMTQPSSNGNMLNQDYSEYIGQYGETTISLDRGKLYTQRPGVPIKLELERIEKDLFKIVLPPNSRGNVPDLRFDRLNGVVVSVTTTRNGDEERTEQKE